MRHGCRPCRHGHFVGMWAFQGDAAHQVQRRPWLTPNDSPGTWYTRRDYRSNWTLHPFHRTVFTAHTWISLPVREPHGVSQTLPCPVHTLVSGSRLPLRHRLPANRRGHMPVLPLVAPRHLAV